MEQPRPESGSHPPIKRESPAGRPSGGAIRSTGAINLGITAETSSHAGKSNQRNARTNAPERSPKPPHFRPLSRTHQPDIDYLIGTAVHIPESVEDRWENKRPQLSVKWILLATLLLAGILIWPLSQLGKGERLDKQSNRMSDGRLAKDARNVHETSRLIDSIESRLKTYFSRTSVEELFPLIRHSNRVAPLMREHYKDKSVFIGHLSGIESILPLYTDQKSNFWVAAAILSNGHKPLITVEVTQSGTILVDWESLVCHQPMDWSEYIKKRPVETPMNFRVYAEPMDFNNHEFGDPKEWLCVRLTAYNSIDFLYGYAKIESVAGRELRHLIKKNRLKKTSLTLRLTVPKDLQSPNGVLVEKVISSNWIYQDDPMGDVVPSDSGSPNPINPNYPEN